MIAIDRAKGSAELIGVHDENHHEIYRRGLSPEELEPLGLQQPEIELVWSCNPEAFQLRGRSGQ